MKYYLMDCGHIIYNKPDIICERCNCSKVKQMYTNVYKGLEGRYAYSKDKKVKSRWDLPGFVYQPDKDFDIYLFGR